MDTQRLLVLGRDELQSIGLPWTDVVDVLEDAFRQKRARALVQNPPKPAVRPRTDAFMNAMPAYLGGSDRVGIKWVAGFEQNRAKGLPYIHGVVVLSDAETGLLLALLDGGLLDHRDAYGRRLRRRDAAGLRYEAAAARDRRGGVQGRRHLELLLARCPGIEQVRVFDRVQEASQALLDTRDRS